MSSNPYEQLDEMPHISSTIDLTSDDGKVNVIKDLITNLESHYTPDSIVTCAKEIKATIDKNMECSYQEGNLLRLHKLADLFKLSDTEIAIIGFILTSLQTSTYREYAVNIQQSEEQKHFTAFTMTMILDELYENNSSLLHLMAPDSLLITSGICEYASADLNKPFMDRQLHLSDRVYSFIKGNDAIDSNIQAFTTLHNVDTLGQSAWHEDIINKLVSYINNSDNTTLSYHLYGNYEIRDEVPQGVCSALHRPLLSVDCKTISYKSSLSLDQIMKSLDREAKLQDAFICLFNTNAYLNTFEETGDSVKCLFIDCASSLDTVVFLCSSNSSDFLDSELNTKLLSVKVDVPDADHRKDMWQTMTGSIEDAEDIAILAATYELSNDQIKRAVIKAKSIALWNGEDTEKVNTNHLYEGSKLQMNHNLSRLARKVDTNVLWDDLILPEEEKTQLKEFTEMYLLQNRILNDWNFKEKSPYGNGLVSLFSGISGTGKTFAAQAIATTLNLDLYVIELSSLVSKYIGETEKNLEKLFNEAEQSNAILFFDEADALFGKRSQVKDAHDRYANIEVGYLLQRIEEYSGIIILATNMSSSMDSAFSRRIKHKIKFDMPKEEERLVLWQQIFPEEAPLDDAIDYEFIAREFDFTGAQIKDAAQTAMFYGAREGAEKITMKHITWSIRRVYLKGSDNRKCTDKTFGKYFKYIEDFKNSSRTKKKDDPVPTSEPKEDKPSHTTENVYDDEGNITGKKDRYRITEKELEKKYGKKNRRR